MEGGRGRKCVVTSVFVDNRVMIAVIDCCIAAVAIAVQEQ